MRDFRIRDRSEEFWAFDRVSSVLRTHAQLVKQTGSVKLSGTSQGLVAAIGVWLLTEGKEVVLTPPAILEESTECHAELEIWADSDRVTVTRQRNAETTTTRPGLGLYTSGSTRAPKLIHIDPTSLLVTTEWYTRIYSLNRNVSIVTGLPATYNFPFIAGACSAGQSGARLVFWDRDDAQSDVIFCATERKVVLANPLQIQAVTERRLSLTPDDLVDSGGAPLSSHAVLRFREEFGDLREGYGLTETASLTHFDQEGTVASCGTVGKAMQGVKCRLVQSNAKPILHITSPNFRRGEQELNTGDVALIDLEGRLRLLGREDDVSINGEWPRDTLDHVGSLIEFAHVQVRHQGNGQVILTFDPRFGSGKAVLGSADKIRAKIAKFLDIPTSSVVILTASGRLHSEKLSRQIS